MMQRTRNDAPNLVPGIGIRGLLELGTAFADNPLCKQEQCTVVHRSEHPDYKNWIHEDVVFPRLGLEVDLTNGIVNHIVGWFDPASRGNLSFDSGILTPFGGTVEGRSAEDLARPDVFEIRERYPYPDFPLIGLDDATGCRIVRSGDDRITVHNTERLFSLNYGSGGKVLSVDVYQP